jgi:hypothetical protein
MRQIIGSAGIIFVQSLQELLERGGFEQLAAFAAVAECGSLVARRYPRLKSSLTKSSRSCQKIKFTIDEEWGRQICRALRK